MNNRNLALGVIETTGYIATIDSLDTLLKTANVEVIDKELIGAGIVVIIIVGDISSVKEAVNSAKKAIERLNYKYNYTVIANPHNDLWNIIP